MLARGYLILGSLLLGGFALVEFEGWEFGSAIRRRPAPLPGMVVVSSWSSSSSSYRHSSSSSGRVPGTGGGGFGGK